jgi:hypothetical protein
LSAVCLFRDSVTIAWTGAYQGTWYSTHFLNGSMNHLTGLSRVLLCILLSSVGSMGVFPKYLQSASEKNMTPLSSKMVLKMQR